MSEELKVLEDWLEEKINEVEISLSDLIYLKKLKKAIIELEAIKDSKPSKAMRCLEYLGNEEISITESEPFHYLKLSLIYEECFESIKDALLKAQKEDKSE